MNVVFSGLAKGILMLVLGAAVTWALIAGLEGRATEEVKNDGVVPSIKHVPGKRADTQWMF
ncbi:MAG TPA: hypothetical protein VFB13_15655 [Reyranella sp.]|jgi:beta-glucosidase-like glycosyl hydrolase|nr:hypothetical protein [Reyranella sp.]